MNIISTWEHIAAALNRSVKRTKTHAEFPVNPLPVRRDDSFCEVWITEEELCEWALSKSIVCKLTKRAIMSRSRLRKEKPCSYPRYRKDAPRSSTMPMTLTSRPTLDEVYRWVLKRETLKPALRFKILSRDRYRCRYCGIDTTYQGVRLEVDHIIPVARGGSDDEDNLITACDKCNIGKSDVHPAAPLGKYAKMPIGCRR